VAHGIDIEHLQGWVGREERRADTITPQLLRAFRAVLDLDPGEPQAGERVPQSLHWCLSPATVPMHAIGPDGHPARGGFLPPVPLPRRMWAGGRLRFQDDLGVGDTVERLSTVKHVTVKRGRTGPLCFVVEHRLSTAGGLALSEEQDIVYRGPEVSAGGGAGRPARCRSRTLRAPSIPRRSCCSATLL
jgi:3-methylfumaryl-CoA hydratase